MGGLTEQKTTAAADAGSKNDVGNGGDQSLLPGRGGNKEGAVHHGKQRDNTEEKRKDSAEIQEHDKASGRAWAVGEFSARSR